MKPAPCASPALPPTARPSARIAAAVATGALALGAPTRALAAQDPPQFLTLQELLEVRIDTATIRDEPWLNQPATLTVMRSQEMASLGARSLQDVLDYVPGMAYGVDVFGINSLIVRGHWAHEGKVLLLYDDLPLNDLLYGSLSVARHYPVEQLERIEVLRGAGMAKYGGNAQLAVIRLQSPVPQHTGLTLSGGTEYLEGAGAGWQTTATGSWVTNELAVSLSGHFAQLPYSGQTWRDTSGSLWDLGDSSGIDAANALFRLDWRDLRFRLLYDRHVTESPQRFGYGVPGERTLFQSVTWSAANDFHLTEHITLTPKITQRIQEDWFIDRDPDLNPTVDFFLPVEKIQYALEGTAALDAFDLLAGVEYWDEHASCESPGGPPGARRAGTYFNGSESVSYNGAAAFLQTDWNHGPWLATAGARYSHHSYAGDSLVPRASLSYVRRLWHLKGIAGQAFREPDIEVINAADPARGPIQPETTTQLEIELGWKPAPLLLGTLALFDLSIDDPIIYTSVGNSGYYYINQDTVRTRGIELDWRLDLQPVRLLLGYSFYSGESIPRYAVPQDDTALLGAPQHKAYASLDYTLPWEAWHALASAVWYSAFYAADYDPLASDPEGNPLSIQTQPDRVLLNLGLRYQHHGWTASLGVSDLLNQGRLHGQPYRSESTPYPAGGRSVWLHVSKHFR